ncbi:MAG: mechanosensitive ion channel family protein [Proteobacteria bacterium]|nr:mechanosensitive ion channel family protein [Pseudomonadota bacterium]
MDTKKSDFEFTDLHKKIIDYLLNHGMQIITAIGIIIAGLFISKWLSNFVQKWLTKKRLEPQLTSLIVRVVKLLILGLFFIMALGQIGVQITPLLAGIGVAGVGVSLAMQGLLGNIVAGLTIIFTKPFTIGEYIELLGVYGQVIDISLFSTTLQHADNSHVVVPNRKIVGEILHNYGKVRQLDLSIGVSYDSDLKLVIKTIEDLLNSNPKVIKDLKPIIGISAFEDSAIRISIKPWVSVEHYSIAGNEINLEIIEKFREKNIKIPFPQREVRIFNDNLIKSS